MGLQDTISALVRAEIRSTVTRDQGGAQGGGGFSGLDRYDQLVAQAFTNGSNSGQALGAFTSEFTVLFPGPNIVQLASNDPLVGMSDDEPSTDPANSQLRAIIFENLDDPVTGNFYDVMPSAGAAGLDGWILGGTGGQPPLLRVPAGSVLLASFPNGLPAWTTPGNGDGLELTPDTAAILARMTYLFG